ncbi:hypothetical protein [Novosphingobium sp. JCM 18896]|uniref:hypothetical protein n=1 Tax=Novosphingobium sp. JCM 18896 TaxID=2989731 RepID=UPI002221D50E|nr:hypothetical protein [Novosphingobium sp. JCM 18896]MCW1431315.1 hypothetical protein [Novosphingobium sp. JCM 18896]
MLTDCRRIAEPSEARHTLRMSPLQQTKLFLVEHLDLAKDALHIYVALTVFLGTCLLLRWKAAQWKPWLAVLVVAVIGEAWDLRDSLTYHTRIDLWGNGKDLWNTMLAPTILMLAARHTRVFQR